MDITVTGINHNIAPIGVREKVSFSETKKIEATNMLTDMDLDEVIILSTCNRSEIYTASSDGEKAQEIVKNFYLSYFGDTAIEPYMFAMCGDDAVRHICEVCCGFDSAVIGEDQILGQVKDALETAMEIKGSSKILNKLFREAITLAKEIKTDTRLSEKPLSLSYIGVKLLKSEVGSFAGRNVLVVGLGKMGLLALRHIKEYGPSRIAVSNRNMAKSQAIADALGDAQAVSYLDLPLEIDRADILITATASPHIIVRPEDISPNRERPLYVLDLALPRDVDEAVGLLPCVRLYDVDSLKFKSEENMQMRRLLMDKSQDRIDSCIRDFNGWMSTIRIDPVIESINRRLKTITDDTLSYIYRKTDLNRHDKKIIEKMVESSLKRLVREVILNLKDTKEEDKLDEYLRVLGELFELE